MPFPQLKKYNKIQTRLVRELEEVLGRHGLWWASGRSWPQLRAEREVEGPAAAEPHADGGPGAILDDLYPTGSPAATRCKLTAPGAGRAARPGTRSTSRRSSTPQPRPRSSRTKVIFEFPVIEARGGRLNRFRILFVAAAAGFGRTASARVRAAVGGHWVLRPPHRLSAARSLASHALHAASLSLGP